MDALLAGVHGDQKSFFTIHNFREFAGYSLVHKILIDPRHNLQEGNAKTFITYNDELLPTPTDPPRRTPLATWPRGFHLEKQSDGNFLWHNGSLKFPLRRDGEQLELSQIPSELFGFSQVRVVHYSITPHKRAFSFLVTPEKQSNGALAALYFVKEPSSETLAEPRRTSQPFSYNLGVGLAAPWSQGFKLDLYSGMSHEAAIRKALTTWDQVDTIDGAIGGLNLDVNRQDSKERKPFSDLNQNSVFVLDQLTLAHESGRPILGMTLPLIDPYRYELLNAQVVIFKSNLSGPDKDLRLERVLLHEFGHVLGLGHPVPLAAGERGTHGQSVMTYHIENNRLSDYDRRAILALYPLATTTDR